MTHTMDRAQHHACVQRALELGRTSDPTVLPELAALLALPSPEIRRLAASAIGKLAGFGADAAAAVSALAPVALRDAHPQARQYALKALKNYGAAAAPHLHDLDDLAVDPQARDYVCVAAAAAAREIREAVKAAADQAMHRCEKCRHAVAPDEYDRSQKAFHRTYCDHCFDTVFLQRRNWETQVLEKQKLYQQAGKKLISLYGRDKPHLRETLHARLATHIRLPPPATPVPSASGSESAAFLSNHPAERFTCP